MVIEYIRYKLQPERLDGFEAAYARAAVALRAAPQCVDYELLRSTEDPSRYVLRIEWTSAEEHLRGFRSGPHFAEFFAEIRPYLPDIEEMTHYAPTPVAGPGGGAINSV
ncbi:putative quinol monooxygenase [Plantactinospora siamensis]|uniref:Quinol monooxygenase n=1 Tax=Plantactinospora siamensis TaxID=555372 RepID=A0ABV6NW25_9ACTN